MSVSTPLSHHAPVPQPSKSSLQLAGTITPSIGPIRRSTRSRPASHAVSPAPQGTPTRYQPYARTASAHSASATPVAIAPAQQSGAAQYTQPTAQTLPPLPGPNPRIPRPQKQALQTTFPSRLRTGSTLLVQPLHLAPPAPTTSGTNTFVAVPADGGRSRRGKAINYAELDSFSESDEEEEEPEEEGSEYAGEGASVPVAGGAGAKTAAKKESTELDRTWLGEPPPKKYISKTPVSLMPVPHITQEAIDKNSSTRECLIPIRVEFDTTTHRIRDCFLWNLYESHLQPEAFAHQFLSEIDVPLSYADQVVAMIRAQIEDNEGIATFGEDEVEEDDEEGPDCRVLLNLDVQIAAYHLMDTIEYSLDPSSSDVLSPSALAHTLASDLSLPTSSTPLIAHALTEELLRRKKDAIDSGVLGGVPQSRARPKEGVGIWREVPPHGWVSGGTPRLEVLSEEELERREGERERAIRRLRRETARQLPVRRRR
ncbi:SNF5-domain-containing protein [Dacryopinax primogenitus]|uniref:SNF5-domain-containing protein n=1 Tax=Dacryopinax primogenitus (strain DJM 731) TaxID=1858805 RepID=M5FTJ0_DACPD|nr:SNF5-domain-containing protein [Dacryopinax primogenitus]EJT98694.1 SNF5-domain-containing protein [Dacryopinax primogenitus]